ncbi:lasso peptide biosynthesis B2 protein [Sphingopyxis fribergensis]
MPATEYAQPLFLTHHAFVAQAGSILIFLDLRDDSYVSLEEKFTRPIGARLGIPLTATDDARSEDASADELEALIADLHEARLLAADREAGKPAILLSHPADIRELPRFGVGGPAVRARHVATFAGAFLKAKVMLRFGHIERTARRVARRREARRRPRDAEEVRELVEIFRKVRPLFMNRRDKCLLDALTLIEFLARFDVYPSWNFGVRTNEFLAHCWVQDEGLVYDDDLENVCDYNVIMRA